MATTFDPNSKSSGEGLFGLPYTEQEAKLVLIPVPWEPTTSYGAGTSKGPELILEASHQVDLYDLEFGNAYQAGIHMQDIPKHIQSWSDKHKRSEDLKAVNGASQELNQWLRKESDRLLNAGKVVGVVGGDHSSPLGLMQALNTRHKGELGILHIDAHADLRKAYEGYEYSHASIMYNVINSDARPTKLVQVGIRDFCEEEADLIKKEKTLIRTYFDMELKRRHAQGDTWLELSREIVSHLPQKVYVSFDIDGLDPALCPNTGTPVPGGLQFHEALILLREIVASQRRIVGFDLNEVSNGNTANEWNGNVGARLLFKLCGWTAVSNGLAPRPAGI